MATIYGTENADYLEGTSAPDALEYVDFIFGLGGNDTIHGLSDYDDLYGNAGNDTIYGDSLDDPLSGFDDLIYGDNGSYSGDGDGDDILYGGGGGDGIFGNGGNDSIYGGYGPDACRGGAGVDFIWGEEGDDILWGDEGDPGIVVGGADQLYGGNGIDQIRGEAGNDYLDGGAGQDSCYGGTGNDYLVGRTGNDFLRGDDGIDTAYFSTHFGSFSGGWNIDMMAGTASTFLQVGFNLVLETDIISEIENIVASNGNDTIKGDNLSNEIYGLAGNDTISGGLGSVNKLYGGQGDDIYILGGGGDRIFDGDGYDTIQLSSSSSLNWVQGIFKGNAGNDVFAPGDFDRYVGSSGNDSIILPTNLNQSFDLAGNAGHDVLAGSVLADTIDGGEHNDLLRGNRGNDKLTGGTGVDTAYYDEYFGDISGGWNISLVTGSAFTIFSTIFLLGTETDTLAQVENVYGSNGRDTIIGDSASNTLYGLDGIDVINGGAAVDVIVGGGGADTLYGGRFLDKFIYTAESDSTVAASDRIRDFTRSGPGGLDIIDVSAIDADASTIMNDAFTSLLTAGTAFTAAGQYRVTAFAAGAVAGVPGPGYSLELNTDSDAVAEMRIYIATTEVFPGAASEWFVL